jgi:hypothetical protein
MEMAIGMALINTTTDDSRDSSPRKATVPTAIRGTRTIRSKEIIKKVKRQQPRILTFIKHSGAPCHNNFGEFLIRIGVLKRKVSGGSVSAEGAHAYAVLRTIYVTCRLRGISFPKYMKEGLNHYIRKGKPMLLKTDATFIVPT